MGVAAEAGQSSPADVLHLDHHGEAAPQAHTLPAWLVGVVAPAVAAAGGHQAPLCLAAAQLQRSDHPRYSAAGIGSLQQQLHLQIVY